ARTATAALCRYGGGERRCRCGGTPKKNTSIHRAAIPTRRLDTALSPLQPLAATQLIEIGYAQTVYLHRRDYRARWRRSSSCTTPWWGAAAGYDTRAIYPKRLVGARRSGR